MRRIAFVLVVLVSVAGIGGRVGIASAAPAGSTVVSLDTAGNQADGPSFGPAVDDAGDVVFTSFAMLSPSDSNGTSDVYLRTIGGQTILVSRTAGGAAANGASGESSISPDGRFIAFESTATNLDGAAGNGKQQVYLYDRDPSGDGYDGGDVAITLESATGSSAPGDGDSNQPSVATTGAEPGATPSVVFASAADDLVAGDFNGVSDIFLRSGSSTSRLTVNANGAEADGGSFAPALTIDGGGTQHVAFESNADNLVAPDDSDGVRDIFVYSSSASPALAQVSLAAAATAVPNGASRDASISTSGNRIAFTSAATNLVAGDTNGASDVFVRDLSKGTTTRISVATDGTQADFASDSPRISGDGKFVVFRSFADNLVAGDANELRDVFLGSVGGGQTVALTAGSNGRSGEPAISSDGSFEAFSSDATNLTGADTNPETDVFERAEDVVPPTAPQATVDANHVANSPTWSGDPTITFTVSATDGAGPVVSGIAGYSAVFDTHPSTNPPRTMNFPSTGPNTTITSTSLTTNATWYFHVRAVDHAGNWGPTTDEGPYKIDVTPPSTPSIKITPTLALVDGVSSALSPSLTLTWSAKDTASGIRGYDLSYVRGAATASGTGWSSSSTVLTLTTKTSKTLTVSTGYTYRFTVRAHDNAGKTTSATTQVTVPVDNPAFAHSTGWTTVANSNDFGGSALESSRYGATMTYTARTTNAIAVIVTTCPGCGTFTMEVPGVGFFTLNTATSATHTKYFVVLKVPFPLATASVSIGVVTSGKPVYIDGLVFQHV